MELPELSNCVLCLQILLLLVLERTISKIHDHIKERAGLAAAKPSTPAPAAGKASSDAAGSRPTVEGLAPEVIKASYRVRDEWEPLQEDELKVVRSIKGWLGPEFGELPVDLLVSFVRGYAYHPEWARASFAYLERGLLWRKEVAADLLAIRPERMPAKRAEFESLVQAGPIGFDADGHPVILDRFGACQPAKLLAAFDQESFILQQAFSRECLRAYAQANCTRRKRRLYKTVQVVDLQGFGWGHTDKRMYALMSACNEIFAWNYPESMHKIIVINAPMAFQASRSKYTATTYSSKCLVSTWTKYINAPMAFQVMWKVVKPWIHPITRSKIELVGSRYEETFREQGIVLTSGGTEVGPLLGPLLDPHARTLRSTQHTACSADAVARTPHAARRTPPRRAP
mgnify:CR=1 FL=1